MQTYSFIPQYYKGFLRNSLEEYVVTYIVSEVKLEEVGLRRVRDKGSSGTLGSR